MKMLRKLDELMFDEISAATNIKRKRAVSNSDLFEILLCLTTGLNILQYADSIGFAPELFFKIKKMNLIRSLQQIMLMILLPL